MNVIIRFAVICALMWLLLYFLGFIVASILILLAILSKRIKSFYKKHKRFSDWEFSHYQRSRHVVIKGITVTLKIREFKRFDRRLKIWETKVIEEPINQIYYTGKADKTTKLDDIFNVYYQQ